MLGAQMADAAARWQIAEKTRQYLAGQQHQSAPASGSKPPATPSGKLLPVETVPILRQLNGFGAALLGQLVDPALSPLYFTRLYLTALWLPIFPLGIYLVSHPRTDNGQLLTSTYRFHARIPISDFHSMYRSQLLTFYASAIAHGLLMLVFIFIALWLLTLAFRGIFGPRHRY